MSKSHEVGLCIGMSIDGRGCCGHRGLVVVDVSSIHVWLEQILWEGPQSLAILWALYLGAIWHADGALLLVKGDLAAIVAQWGSSQEGTI